MKNNLRNVIVFFIFCSLSLRSVAQTSLNAGDMAVLSWSSTTNKVQVVTFRDLDPFTVINFTDWGWLWSDGSTAGWAPNSVNSVAEGNIQWTLQSAVPRGTIIEITYGASTAIVIRNVTTNTVISTGPSVANGIAITGHTSIDQINNNGDNFFIYQGSSSNPKFIFGLDNTISTNSNVPVVNAATGWTDNGSYTIGWLLGSNLPDGTGSQNALTSGVNAVGFSTRTTELAYTGSTAATDATTWLSRIANPSNWTGSSTPLTPTYGTILGFTGSLPLTWISFTAASTGAGVALKWETAAEVNTKSFTVQWSTNGSNWSHIGIVAAQNNTAVAPYAFLHASPAAGGNHYRLLQEDMDGRSAFSKVVTVSLAEAKTRLVVYPNPAIGGNLQVQVSKASVVRVYNQAGVQLLEKSVAAGTHTLALGEAVKGTYYIKANGETVTVLMQ